MGAGGKPPGPKQIRTPGLEPHMRGPKQNDIGDDERYEHNDSSARGPLASDKKDSRKKDDDVYVYDSDDSEDYRKYYEEYEEYYDE
jgi:hypothetical protein